ncbi:hypothetical protein TVAG_440370 [Trichomonas vaginalis G3]|uniref:TNFR-Cys domain-containing protein n=1 Tax=Trichomonas vaginalis (strain ATCC PRA-98 / G3) TaxID=412133 RepID=A2F1J3_TRIV3|nr:serine-type endopeptidase protein [Trichomonas vaginalis G3]EAY01211.1 hypothetical protein TVAG_440370 [Trichomonas vaginalis G3]KAI5532509.1 serine-type endopeptidase protein [Trichomonas vaginalis G3]|eukprot:XP_001330127.1 hypothetical protein [Trichomonas vaginalis G3]
MYILFYSNLVVKAENGIDKSGTLSPGQYQVECRGAQGRSFPSNAGGCGSKVTAQFKVINTMHYDLKPGTEGTSLTAGYPDGGKASSLSYGNGGGSSKATFRSDENYFMIAAGGSGASENFRGAHGGGNNTYFIKKTSGILFDELSDTAYLDAPDSYHPGWALEGSGGGGGCMIGKGGFKNGGNRFSEIGVSGTSCHSSGNFFRNIDIKSGDYDLFQGDGYVELTYDYLCMTNCIDCDSSSSCNRCDSSHVLYNNGCSLTNCPESYYNNSGRCYACIAHCKICSNSNSCRSCKSSYLLYGGRCDRTTCPPFTYNNSNVCDSCITNREQCSDGNSCRNCKSPYLLYGGRCDRTTCPLSTYKNGNQCDNCIKFCKQCTNSSICLNCTSSYVLRHGNCTLQQCFNNKNGNCSSILSTENLYNFGIYSLTKKYYRK